MDSMGSYSQVVVGGMLLVIAFFFGRYINQQPIAEKSPGVQNSLAAAPETSSPAVTATNQIVDDADSQRSLRDRILSQRAQASPSKLNLKPVDSEAVSRNEVPTSNLADAFVEPDFSHLQSFESATPIRSPKLPSSEMAEVTPKFDAATKPSQSKQVKGRFTINRPAPDRLPQQSNDRFDSIAQRSARNSSARPVINPIDGFKGSQKNQRTARAADNPRSSMVPVRERIGVWNPEPKDYVNYTTVFGDTLHSLSTKFFGTPDRYLDIYLANRKLIKSPSDVPVNTEIRIPVMK